VEVLAVDMEALAVVTAEAMEAAAVAAHA
jgi:hypothetical protein